ncbi:hypothetical protein F4561_001632 [Lipingzhangella halophila]|uniref:DUF2470 domain-containing protein n=1 Tax=Lipingzhangella halophila TaxID=1783352 RepID=A0A7W7RF18_9ACTN|nr:DUF2470 domain-containing protein [Lipingzhangella halophila]MBB4930812.1 hypothetical protein [Lipingzhangella halophila]
MRRPSPSTIERIRSLASTATPTAVALADEPGTRFSARGAVERAGRVILLIDAGHPLHEMLRTDPHGDADLEISVDLCALRHVGHTPTVRARMWCDGGVSVVPAAERREAALAVWERDPDESLLAAAENDPRDGGPLLARVEPGTLLYHTYDSAGVIDGADFRATEPDPLTGPAEHILRHINDRHRDELSASLRHLPNAPQGAAWIWELDGLGVTLWVNRTDDDHPALIRVPWSARATAPCQLERALHDLMAHQGASPLP